ncbi:hypothetical protein [Mucilaginibacter pedocola]|nr:hypothetical protein [Mucilaginibacter pedocola]
MKYSEWNKLTDEEKKNTHWRKHPHVRVGTIFTVLFAIVFGVALLRIFKNKRVHVNRQPNAAEAFNTAKSIVKNKFPRQVTFPTNKFDAQIDTAKNLYSISSTLNAQDSTGQFVKKAWQVNLSYTGGDWADTLSWHVNSLTLQGK